MNKELKNIDEAIKNILKKTEDDEILSNLAQISRSIRIVKENWLDISSLIESRRKLISEVVKVLLLLKYIEYFGLLNNIVNNYKNKRWGYK